MSFFFFLFPGFSKDFVCLAPGVMDDCVWELKCQVDILYKVALLRYSGLQVIRHVRICQCHSVSSNVSYHFMLNGFLYALELRWLSSFDEKYIGGQEGCHQLSFLG
ncbi:hypothetical protein OTU49_007999 [Cherax quadricarinatus]|uniref:Secreted protein n=1 Tax=Cherax quadricarinatus TaxID=27406 RepID=A0AAW0WSR6_CHEQU